MNKNNEILDKIEKIRSKNNSNWMAIVKLAFDKSPAEAKKIMKRIVEQDEQIKGLCKELIDSDWQPLDEFIKTSEKPLRLRMGRKGVARQGNNVVAFHTQLY